MKTSRRSLLELSGGAALLASGYAGPKQATASPQDPPPKLALEDFQPKSMLVAAGHPVERASFPVIDVHAHVAGHLDKRSAEMFRQLDQIVQWMEALNIQVINNVTGGYGDQLKRNVSDLEGRHPGRIINCVTPGYERLHGPGYPQWQADELNRAKDMGARGLKILKFQVDANKGVIIDLDVDEEFRHPPSADSVEAFDGLRLPDKYIYFPANFWPYKNHANLLRATRMLVDGPHPDLSLVLTGASEGAAGIRKQIARLGLQNQVRLLDYQRRDVVVEIYRHARALAFVSKFEGFGIPILETTFRRKIRFWAKTGPWGGLAKRRKARRADRRAWK